MLLPNGVKEFVAWLGVFGIPSIFTMTMWCIKKCKTYTTQLSILMQAQKAQMRSQLLEQFHEYEGKGFVTEEELEDWENQYQAYHKLVGPNGILDARRTTLFSLPTKQN